MAEVKCAEEVPASADAVWALLGDFNGLDTWIGAVTSSSIEGAGVGALRTLTLADGGTIVEKLESHDDAGCALSYSIVSGPLPVKDYLSTIKVTPIDEARCKVEWGSTSTPVDVPEAMVVQILNGMYSGGLRDLVKHFGG